MKNTNIMSSRADRYDNETYRRMLDELYRSSQIDWERQERAVSEMIADVSTTVHDQELKQAGANMRRELYDLMNDSGIHELRMQQLEDQKLEQDWQRELRWKLQTEEWITDCHRDRMEREVEYRENMRYLTRRNNELEIDVKRAIEEQTELVYERHHLRDRIQDMSRRMTRLMKQLNSMEERNQWQEQLVVQLELLHSHLLKFLEYVINCTQSDAVRIKTQQQSIETLEKTLDLRMNELCDLERENEQLKRALKEKDEQIGKLNDMNQQMKTMYEHEIDRAKWYKKSKAKSSKQSSQNNNSE